MKSELKVLNVCQHKIKCVLSPIIHEHKCITLWLDLNLYRSTSQVLRYAISQYCVHGTCSVTTTKIYSIIFAALINSGQMVLPYLSSHGLAVKE